MSQKEQKVTFFENGQKESEANYQDGKKDGLSTKWYENGKKFREANYKNGKKIDLETRWHSNGSKESEVNYKDGKSHSLLMFGMTFMGKHSRMAGEE